MINTNCDLMYNTKPGNRGSCKAQAGFIVFAPTVMKSNSSPDLSRNVVDLISNEDCSQAREGTAMLTPRHVLTAGLTSFHQF